ncbi:GrpB family protein [Ornithinibacillus halophilus]|uniref:GrpB domain, predicted nucleotidyltransferase, UPF0157 family n=1 Tax=Ornithinibacillus halophilus TaxID=930117 RepID=A0A1M5IN99_9BACI|nr:GrpB family protein [Ornithinibacillus halophilus]SHG29844.1 GrpB domain, predicted nucleotidyltransferase, UPF0157 family [Ornithinibacillus halophilus]
MRKLELMPFKENWMTNYNEESKRVQEIFGELLLNIHHIGSTSIPGMIAKPVIDILVEIQNINDVDSFNNDMKMLGYVPKGENGIRGRRYFFKEKGNKRTHHVHIFQSGSHEINKHLAFRDYLIIHQDEAERYIELKRNLYQRMGVNVKQYQEMKGPLIQELTDNALNWANKNKKTSVMGFIIRQKEDGSNELLTLSISSIPYASLRVPGGGVEGNEDLIGALNREILEEAGLSNLTLIRKIGSITYYKPYIKRMVERHDFLLLAPADIEDSWGHRVTGGDKDSGLSFNYRWIQEHEFPKLDGELRSFISPEYISELFNR